VGFLANAAELDAPRAIRGLWLGRRPYRAVLEFQEQLFEARKLGTIGDTVLFVEHEPVITLGRGAHGSNLRVSPEALENRGVELVRTNRGGDITLHAPGQLVCYPILDLSPKYKDVRRYVRMLAEVMRQITLTAEIDGGIVDEFVGLWIDQAQVRSWPGQERARHLVKIGAIGVRISRWVTMHGFALNLSTDLDLFEMIIPCGIGQHGVTSVAALRGFAPPLVSAAAIGYEALAHAVGASPVPLEDATRLPLATLFPS
jgi:lipoyl(octanoyl) transferase